MAVMQFDEISQLGIDDFFRGMRLDKTERELRIEQAKQFNEKLLLIFALIATYSNFSTVDWYFIEEQLKDAYLGVYGVTEVDYEYRALLLIDSTKRNIETPYYLSDDRAKLVAENETNTIRNKQLDTEARENGKTLKRWVSEHDFAVRPTHRVADGQTIPIDQPFEVNGSLLMYPTDDSLGASGSELVNCRCVAEYL